MVFLFNRFIVKQSSFSISFFEVRKIDGEQSIMRKSNKDLYQNLNIGLKLSHTFKYFACYKKDRDFKVKIVASKIRFVTYILVGGIFILFFINLFHTFNIVQFSESLWIILRVDDKNVF